MLVNLAGSLQRSLNQAFKIMAKATFSEIISDLRGKIGRHVWTTWKGIPVVKLAPNHSKYSWSSPLLAIQRNVIDEACRRWAYVLDYEQRHYWEIYATYLATLPTDYIKLTGWKNYGGTMSGFNAYTLTNSMRASVGKEDWLDDAPNEIESPGQPVLTDFEYIINGAPKLRATVVNPASFPETSYLRAWCRGTRYAHLILAAYAEAIPGAGIIWTVHYDGSVLPEVAVPPWVHWGGNYATTDGDKLTIDTITPGGTAWCWYARVPAFNPAVGYTVECRLQVVTGAVLDDRIAVYFGDGVKLEILRFSETAIGLAFSGQTYNMDTTDAQHTYLITVLGTAIKIYVDNVLRIEGTMTLDFDTPRIEFGAGSLVDGQNSKEIWDYVKYYEGGAVPPGAPQIIEWEQMRYAQGARLGIQRDTYRCQLDIIGESGRFSPPSEILGIIVNP